MAKSAVLRTVAVEGRRVGRRTDAEYGRMRKYLTPAEVELLIATAKKRRRYGQRDALAILMCYRHGLRVSELVALRWSQIAWEGTPRLTVERRKDSISGVAQPLVNSLRAQRIFFRGSGVPSMLTGSAECFAASGWSASCRWFTRTN